MIDAFPLRIDPDLTLQYPDTAWAETIFDIIEQQRAYLEAWLPWVERTTNLAKVKSMLKEARIFNRHGQSFTSFLYWQDQLVGSIAFSRLDRTNRSGELGYWLRQDFQGRGIVTKACRTFIDFGFNQLQLHRIEIKVLSINEKSRAIPQRLGFRQEGLLKGAILRKGIFCDLEIYSCLQTEWPIQSADQTS